VSYLIDDLLEVAFPFTNALRITGLAEMASAYELALWQGVPVAVELTKVMLEPETADALLLGVGLKVVAVAAVDRATALSFIDRYETELLKPKPADRAAYIVQTMRDLLDRSAAEAKKSPSMAELRQYYEQQAAGLGIDLNNPNDPIAQVVRIGLDDLDPTRIARNCRHIHLRHGTHGVPAEMLGLPSAGTKSVMCLKHGHSIEGMKLDDIYALFARRKPWSSNQKCCESCPDVHPHPDGWTWSNEWAAEQDARFQQMRRSSDSRKE
jgi:hypothetical protein